MTRQAGFLACLAVAVPLLSSSSSAHPAQTGREQVVPGPLGVVVGQVVDADTSRPLGGAMVDIRGGGPAAGREPFSERAITDGAGRFVFSQIPPGVYMLSSLRPGYVPAQHGQSRPRGRASALNVGTTPPVTEATVRMWAYAAITGAVRDATGEPVVGATVRAARADISGGRRILRRVLDEGMTDDRGAYRVAKLEPGDYVVFVPSTVESAAVSTATWYTGERAQSGAERALLQQLGESRAPSPSPNGLRVGGHIISSMSMRLPIAPMLTPDGRLNVVPSVYYPSSATLEGATTIRLSSGEERPGIDLRLSRESAFHVRGRVTGPDGPAALIGVRLLPAAASQFEVDYELEVSSSVTGLDGGFTLLGVPAGQYNLKVLRVPRLTQGAQAADGSEPPTLWALHPLVVGDADVEDVELHLQEGARVIGRLQFEGAALPESDDLGRFAVRLVDASGRTDSAYLRPPTPQTDGTFRTFGYPPGRYFVDFVGAAPGGRWHLKSATLGVRDLMDEPLELGTDDVDGVIVTFTDRLSEITGTVSGLSTGQEALVAVFPADYRAWIDNGMPSARTAAGHTDESGRFTIANLRAGDYLAVALPDSDAEPDLDDPAVVTRLASQAMTVRLPDRGSAFVALSLSRIGRRP